MRETFRNHWPEYLMEAAGLGIFMLAAVTFATLLFHPEAILARVLRSDEARRAIMGSSMGLTAVTLIYSPWGRRSGAHLNPAVTMTFLRLGKIAPWDAAFYALFQVGGGLAGVAVGAALLGPAVAHPEVNYVVTVPGPSGTAVAFVAEAVISAGLMAAVLVVSNIPRLARFTGLCAGALVATWITVEAPLSGMSMNPARTLASAAHADVWTAIWVYGLAPPLGMLAAAELYRRRLRRPVRCAKLHHDDTRHCIFRCGAGPASAASGETSMTRRLPATVALVVAALALLVALHGQPAPASTATAPLVEAVTGVGITVSDMERAVDFYARVLGFERLSDVEDTGEDGGRLVGLPGARTRVVRMRLGEEVLELTQYHTPRGRPAPPDSRSQDRWFQHVAIIVNDMEQAYLWLRRHGVEHVSPAPQRLPDWNPNAGGIQAFYFRDPDGHPLEILQFPPDKGDPRWHRPSERVFLGIDHTAIVVGDTETSLRFYRDFLGFRVVVTSENWGPEQERLNNVAGARLRITTLRARRGPAIEFLEYLAPRDGRGASGDLRPNDLAHWHTILQPGRLESIEPHVRAHAGALVSPGIVAAPDAQGITRASLLARDPDGHALLLRAR